ncbi:MAG: MFS transporter [Acetobacteraceae bacterium]
MCSRTGINGLNFFVAAMQTGFGPFIAVWLTRQHWDDTDIGLALSIGTGVALLGQLPGGLLVDALGGKRRLMVIALLVMAFSAVMLALPATLPTIWGAQVLHSLASCVITPAIAAITLAACGHAAFSERLGVNARYASLGNAAAGGLLGVVSYYWSEETVFWATALMAIPAIGALIMVRIGAPSPVAVACAAAEEQDADAPAFRPMQLFREPALHMFALCAVLFHLSNAALLPLALNGLAQRTTETDFAVSATIILPQAVMAAFAPWAGALAQRIGRRPVLLAGFAALPLRAILFATAPDAGLLVLYQALDGVSATVFGLMMPLIAADLTRRTGHLNLAIGAIGLAAGIGATFSTTLAGLVSDHVGPEYAFLGLAGAGVLAVLLVLLAMPETRPGPMQQTRTAAVAI